MDAMPDLPPASRDHRRHEPSVGLGRMLGALAVLIVASSSAGPARAEEVWVVRTGRVHLHLNVGLLSDLGIEVEVGGAASGEVEGLLLEEPYWTFPIRAGSDLRFRAEHGVVVPGGGASGAVRLEGTLVIRDRATGRTTRLDDLEIAPLPELGAAPAGARRAATLQLRSAGTKLGFCELRNAMFDFRGRPGLRVHYMNACISASWARAIGRPELAGWVIGLGEARALAELVSATAPAGPADPPNFTSGVLDVSLGALADVQQVAHAGTFPNGAVAVAMATTSCNLGTVDVPWLAPMDEQHPVIHMALYRLLAGRFEQIGVSWMKHGFYALSSSDCTQCQNPSDGTFLGVGCSDTYDVANNSSRNELGPRVEVDPFAGTWTCKGSHFSGGVADCVRRHGTGGHGALDHRLVVADADLAIPGATYYYEANYIVAGDEMPANNWGHRRCTMTWNGSVWVFSTPEANPLVPGPALSGWGEASDTVVVAPGDGEVLLAVQTTDLGAGRWGYEYALLNLNSDRQIRAFSLPVGGVPNIGGIGFHDNDAVAANDWSMTLEADTLRWQTGTYAQDPNARALVFGYLYNFRFEADAPPGAVGARLGLFKPGVGATVDATSLGPVAPVAAVGDAAAPGARVIDIRPNPSTRSATIRYQAMDPGAELGIFDASGRRMRTLADPGRGAGVRSVVWDGRADDGTRVRPGVYYVRLRSGSVTAARSLVMVD